MDIQITRDVDVEELAALYREAEWLYTEDGVEEGADVVEAIVQKTYAYAIAVDEGRIVGFGRAISDGVSDAYIQDIYVKKSERRKGVGQRIVRSLVDHLLHNKIRWIALIGEPGTAPFYSPCGFKVLEQDVPMLWEG